MRTHTHVCSCTHARTHARKQQMVTIAIKPNRIACDTLDLLIFGTGDHTTTKPLSPPTSSIAVPVFARSDATPDDLDPHRTNHQSPPSPVDGYPPHTRTRTHTRTHERTHARTHERTHPRTHAPHTNTCKTVATHAHTMALQINSNHIRKGITLHSAEVGILIIFWHVL